MNAIRQEMKELFSDYNAHVSVLFKRMQEQLENVAAQLANISQRLPPRGKAASGA